MTSVLRSCCTAASDAASTVARAFTRTPAFYAESGFIRTQRIAAVALIAMGIIASAYAPLTAGATAPFAAPLIIGGFTVLGLSLLQEVAGQARGCEHGKISRIFAGINFMCPLPINWLIGALCWSYSDAQNDLARRR